MNISYPPKSEVVESDCSQVHFSSAFTDDPFACALTGDSSGKEEYDGRWALRRDGDGYKESPCGGSISGHPGAGLRSPSHLLRRFRNSVRLLDPLAVWPPPSTLFFLSRLTIRFFLFPILFFSYGAPLTLRSHCRRRKSRPRPPPPKQSVGKLRQRSQIVASFVARLPGSPRFPRTVANTCGFSDRGMAAFRMRGAETNASGEAPTGSILNFALRRRKSGSTKFTSIV